MMPKPGPKPAERTCPTCKGTGMVTRHYQDRHGHWHVETRTCGDCGGAGTVSR